MLLPHENPTRNSWRHDGHRTRVVVSCVLDKRVEVLSHDGVQYGGFRQATGKLHTTVGCSGRR